MGVVDGAFRFGRDAGAAHAVVAVGGKRSGDKAKQRGVRLPAAEPTCAAPAPQRRPSGTHPQVGPARPGPPRHRAVTRHWVRPSLFRWWRSARWEWDRGAVADWHWLDAPN